MMLTLRLAQQSMVVGPTEKNSLGHKTELSSSANRRPKLDTESERSGMTADTALEDVSDTSSVSSEEEQAPPLRIRSILKPHTQNDLFVSSKSSSWKSLSPPNMEQILRNSISPRVTATTGVKTTTHRRQRSVGFASITIREYEPTVGDNPSVSYGPPIQLDWEFKEFDDVDLEHYEATRPPRRSLRELCLNYYQRRNVLIWKCGMDEQSVKQLTKEINKTKKQRAVTKYFLPCAIVEDFVTSAARKTKRAVSKQKA